MNGMNQDPLYLEKNVDAERYIPKFLKKFTMNEEHGFLFLQMIDSREGASFARESPPSCFKWATSLSDLLQDPEGVQLFKKYAESEGGIHSDWLNFYFACEGLKQEKDPEKIKQLVYVIYR